MAMADPPHHFSDPRRRHPPARSGTGGHPVRGGDPDRGPAPGPVERYPAPLGGLLLRGRPSVGRNPAHESRWDPEPERDPAGPDPAHLSFSQLEPQRTVQRVEAAGPRSDP